MPIRLTRQHKYRAKPTTVDGVRFASKKESRRYAELKLLEKAGEIRGLEIQPSFDLLVPVRTDEARMAMVKALARGKGFSCAHEKVGVYRADFRYQQKTLSASENDRYRTITEDVKGIRTATYRLKKRMVEATYGIQIHEI